MRPRPSVPTIDELRQLASAHGIDRLGVAAAEPFLWARHAIEDRNARGFDAGMGFTFRNPARASDPSFDMPEARSIIVVARSYALETPPHPGVPAARVGRYAWVDHYGELRRALRAISRRLKAAGERATAYCDDNRLVDREAAYRAGLGWFGKNANLLLDGLGSWFVLGSVVTTAAYEPATPRDGQRGDGCGTCTRCLPACPTGAIVEPGVIDGNRCLSWVLQRPGAIPESLRVAVGDRIYGCDDCQDACPPTVRLSVRRPGQVPEQAEIVAWVPVLDLLEADDATLLARHGRWYIAERDPRWLRRNALVVLGNIGALADERTRDTLTRYIDGGDELLAEHARWAWRQLAAAHPPAADLPTADLMADDALVVPAR